MLVFDGLATEVEECRKIFRTDQIKCLDPGVMLRTCMSTYCMYETK